MRSYQAVFTTITLSIILSACGGGSAVTESGQVASNQDTAVSSGSETIIIPPSTNAITSSEEQPSAATTPVTTTTTVKPVTTTQTPTVSANAFGAASLTTATVSNDDVVLSWNQTNDTPQSGYNVFIDGVSATDLTNIAGTTATVQGLDLSVQHCFYSTSTI